MCGFACVFVYVGAAAGDAGVNLARAPVMSKHSVWRGKINGKGPALVQQSAGSRARRLVCAKWSSQNIKGQPSRRRRRLTNFKLARKRGREGVEGRMVGGGGRGGGKGTRDGGEGGGWGGKVE